MNKYLDFTIEREHNVEVLQHGSFSHRQSVTTKVTSSIHAVEKDFVQIESALNTIVYEYKQFLTLHKDGYSNASFNLTFTVGIYTKQLLMRFAYYKSYDITSHYYKPSVKKDQLEYNNVVPTTATALLGTLKYSIAQLLDCAMNYDKE